MKICPTCAASVVVLIIDNATKKRFCHHCVEERRERPTSVADLRAEAARLIASGEMPSLEEVVAAIETIRSELVPKLHALWKEQLELDFRAKVAKR